MKKYLPAFISLASLLLLPFTAAAAPFASFQVSPDTFLAKTTPPNAVLSASSCDWQSTLVKYLAKQTSGAAKSVLETELNPDGVRLQLVFQSSDGEVATKVAPKWMSVAGAMFNANKLVGEFEFKQEIAKGTLQDCETSKNVGKMLIDDVESWLSNPSVTVQIAPAVALLNKDALDESIIKNCAGTTHLPKYLAENSSGHIILESPSTSRASNRQLKLTLNNSRIAPGGAYSGAKWMEFSGELMDQGRMTGSFTAHRWTIKGWTNCGAFERLSEWIGGDILDWLNEPTMNAKLGNAQ